MQTGEPAQDGSAPGRGPDIGWIVGIAALFGLLMVFFWTVGPNEAT